MKDSAQNARRNCFAVAILAVFLFLIIIFQFDSEELNLNHEGIIRAKIWNTVEPLENVAMRLEETKHYQMFSPEGIEETSNLLPPSGYKTTLDGHTYTIAMFHQLECLRILRRDLKAPLQSDDAKNCMNYLRQSVLCHADTQLEAVFIPSNMTSGALAVLPKDYRCRDWSKLFAQVM